MESTSNNLEKLVVEGDPCIPKDKRVKDSTTQGTLDEFGFFRTPNGSFWDPDNEYFNRQGYDIHGGYYSKDGEYVPGPDWLSDLGCYPDEKEKYLNVKYDEEEFDDEEIDESELFKGDFEDENNDEDYDMNNINNINSDLKDLGLDDKKLIEQYLNSNTIGGGIYSDTIASIHKNIPDNKKNLKKKNKKKTKKKADEESEGWETVSDDDLEKEKEIKK
jgi:hypothetical protein